MAEIQDKKQPNSRIQSAVAPVRRALSPLNSPLLLDTLRLCPLFGNLAIALLLGGIAAAGYFLFDKEGQINPASMCQQMSSSEAVIAQIEGTDTRTLDTQNADPLQIVSATPSRNLQSDALFTCEFVVTTAANGTEEREPKRERFNIVYQVVSNDLVRSIEDEKIEREVLEAICEDEAYYTRELSSQGYAPKLHNIVQGGLVLEEDSDNVVYPVFRWKCQYQLVLKDSQKTNKPTIQAPNYLVGLDLDAYCEDTFGDRNLIRARYHHYNDPSSLYCVNPNY